MIQVSKLKNNPNNPRKIDNEALEKLMRSISQFPEMMIKRPMVCVTDTDNKLFPLGGNMRLKAIKKLGMKEIPETWVSMADDWTEEQRRQFIIKDNASLGQWDIEDLNLNWNVDELEEWGVDVSDFKLDIEELDVEEDDFNASQITETNIVLGDIIEIGRHRLVCGDSTNQNDIDKLMNGATAQMVFTDPPYDIDINYDIILSACTDANVFIFNNDRALVRQLKGSTLDFKKFIVFSHRGTAIPQEGGNEMFLDHILISHETVGDAFKYIKGNGYRTTIVGEYRKCDNHKHGKPIKVLEPIIKGYTEKDFIVLDIFAGGGSTMVACEQLNRVCYCMEIEPIFCQRIIDRMIKYNSDIIIKINGQEYLK